MHGDLHSGRALRSFRSKVARLNRAASFHDAMVTLCQATMLAPATPTQTCTSFIHSSPREEAHTPPATAMAAKSNCTQARIAAARKKRLRRYARDALFVTSVLTGLVGSFIDGSLGWALFALSLGILAASAALGGEA